MDAEQKFQMILYLVKEGMAYIDAKQFVEDVWYLAGPVPAEDSPPSSIG